MVTHIVSAIIPTHERGALLERALLSVMSQDRLPDEVVIVNGSIHPLADIEVRFGGEVPVIVLEQGMCAGASAARNAGALQARGTYLAFLDDDDEWLPPYISTVLATAQDHNADVVCTDFVARNSRGVDVREKSAPMQLLADEFIRHNAGLRGSNLFIRKSVYHAVGGFDVNLWSLNDLDIAIRLSHASGICYRPLNTPLVRFNNHDGPRLSTPCSKKKSDGVRSFYEKYSPVMTESQRRHFQWWVRSMWCVDENGNITGDASEAADGTDRSRPIT